MHVLVLYFLLFNLKPYDLLIVKRTPTFDFCLSFEARLFLSNNDDKKTCFSSLAFASEFDTHKSRRPSRVVENFTLEKELSRFWHDSSLDTSKMTQPALSKLPKRTQALRALQLYCTLVPDAQSKNKHKRKGNRNFT